MTPYKPNVILASKSGNRMEERGRIKIDIELGTPLGSAQQLAARKSLEERSDVDYIFNQTQHKITFKEALGLYSLSEVVKRVNSSQEVISKLGEEIKEKSEDIITELEYCALAEELRTTANR